jgi:hypothetical protein
VVRQQSLFVTAADRLAIERGVLLRGKGAVVAGRSGVVAPAVAPEASALSLLAVMEDPDFFAAVLAITSLPVGAPMRDRSAMPLA